MIGGRVGLKATLPPDTHEKDFSNFFFFRLYFYRGAVAGVGFYVMA